MTVRTISHLGNCHMEIFPTLVNDEGLGRPRVDVGLRIGDNNHILPTRHSPKGIKLYGLGIKSEADWAAGFH
jgi:hypothetical protein